MVACGAVRPASVNSLPDDTLTDTGDHARGPTPCVDLPHLFVVLEGSRPSAGSARYSLAAVARVVLGRGETRGAKRVHEPDGFCLLVIVPDARASLEHARLTRIDGGFFIEDLGSRNGTRINGERATGPVRLTDGDWIEIGHTLLRYRSAFSVPVGTAVDVDSSAVGQPGLLATLDPVLQRQLASLETVAASASPLLLLGETGTGKEVLARAIHRLSGRRGSFVAVNCGALPATLLESQLFGHVRGAFSGAVGDAPGLLRAADGGTLLLDEIGDLPEPSQAALLRVLQEREVVPVGSARPIKVDLRVVAATHRPLPRLVEEGLFRNDLFARLAGFTFSIPPLRERREDIGLLIEAFARGTALRIAPSAARALMRYEWPRNVRELHHVLEVGATLAGSGPLELAHLPPEFARVAETGKVTTEVSAASRLRERLALSLAHNGGNVSKVARDLGKARMQIQRWIKRFGLDPKSFR